MGLRATLNRAKPLFLLVTQTVGWTAAHTDVCLWYVLRGDRSAAFSWDAGEVRAVAWFHKDRLPIRRSDPHVGRLPCKLAPHTSS